MPIHKVQALMTLQSSVSHIGESTGTEAVFHRTKLVASDGNIRSIPTITGNGIRGLLRDHAAAYLLDALELPDQTVSLSAFYTLFSGGSLSKGSGTGSVDLGAARRLREALPMISVWGAAVGSTIMAGKLNVGMVLPIAKETTHLIDLHPALVGDDLPSVYDLMQSESYTRKDDGKDVLLDKYHAVEARDKDAAPQQMRYQVETMVAGTRCHWWYVLSHGVTPIEIGAFASALKRWGEHPKIGGKGAVGHGVVETVLYLPDGQTAEVISPHMGVYAPELALYDQHIRDNRETILEVLNAL
jgi:hypothetical protein